ncbi:MAG: 2-oxo acid dehydrogenase subunit E2 [Chloroflexi bacterium]|nr:2-oxo acid dehydrogenase subunit E2 [Chloroflexota bacterium]
MPSLGFDMTEGKLANWLKKEGDRVEKGQAIAEIETEKATVEIEATESGLLQKIIVPAGQTVPVGTILAMIGVSTSPPFPPLLKRSSVSGEGEGSKGDRGEARIKASPLARRMAQEAGLDLAQIKGTGPGGRIMERDIQAAAPPPPRPSPVRESGGQGRERPPTPLPRAAEGRVGVPLNKMRQAIARRMTESKTTVPHFYVTVEVNMAEALKMREQLNAVASDAEKISVNDLVIAAAARILLQFPNFNATYRDGALGQHPQIAIGIAVALEDGLITPVLREPDKKSLKQIAAESKALNDRARNNKLRADDLGNGTFTVSNLGMFGVDEFIAIINPPEAAILAVGAAVKRPIVADDDEVKIAPMMKATISVDHRVADGAQSARFMQALKKLLENPVNLLVN